MSAALKSHWFAAVLFVSFLAAVPGARAQVYKGTTLVRADLLADTTVVAPCKPFTVGLRLRTAPHWHTYWQYSGDAGIPTKITWQLPEGFKAGPIQWPVPEKIVSPGDIVNYAYEGEVVLLTEITPPAQLPPGEITVAAKADWLVCEATCIPGSAELSLRLPGGSAPAAANVDLFELTRESLPRPLDAVGADTTLEKRVEGNDLIVSLKTSAPEGFQDAGEFFPLPDESLTIGHPGASELSPDKHTVRTRIPVTDGPKDPKKLAGAYAFRSVHPVFAYAIPAGPQAGKKAAALPVMPVQSGKVGKPARTITAKPIAPSPAGSLGYFLLLGLLGGLILNVMPCVLPVISLKLFSLVKQSGDAPERILRLGLSYTAGVFTWFLGFAALVVGLKAAGHEVGYAFHLQNPWFIFGLSAATFVFALNLLGVFEIILPGSVTNAAGVAASGSEGYAGAYVQGMLATVLGSACTAPVFGAALGFAFAQSAPVVFLMFAAIAAGMSAPFLLIAANPRWLRFLPRPGEWMERVKQGTGFLMLATVLWLLWTLGRMRGSDAVVWTGVLLLFLGVACWVQGAFNTLVSSDRSRWFSRAAIAGLVFGGGWCAVGQVRESQLPSAGAPRAFGPQLAAALETGRPVFVDFTADWCVNCKVNERAVLNTTAVQKAIADRNTLFLKADWTTGADDITKLLKQFGRVGVPLYVLYPAGKPDAPVVMPELLTQQIVLDAFAEADQRAKGAGKAAVAVR